MSTEAPRPPKRRWTILAVMLLVLVVTGFISVRALGLRELEPDAEPFPQPESELDYTWWNGALGRWVVGKSVSYDAVLRERADLRRFVATLAAIGPSTSPARFETEPSRLAYYINAYNALVLFGVIENWPIDTVQDVQGWLNPRDGFGFFYGLRFPLDGRTVNLYDLENETIRAFGDARIHAAINCASRSCPPLMGYAFEPPTLDGQLDEVTRRFVSDPMQVEVDHARNEIRLSAIFDWYRVDFEEHARRLGRQATVLDFIGAFASEDLRATLGRARSDEYEVVFRPYDWLLNRAEK